MSFPQAPYLRKGFRGAPLRAYPTIIPGIGEATEIDSVEMCSRDRTRPTHVAYRGTGDDVPLCLVCALTMDSLGAGRTEESLLARAEELDRKAREDIQ